jgi:hypothetical protein
VAKRRAVARKKRRKGDDRVRDSQKVPALSWPYRIGRLLQFVGLLILPFGIASELVGTVGLGQSLLIAGVGALVFYSGYVIQNKVAAVHHPN